MKRKTLVSEGGMMQSPPLPVIAGLTEHSQNVAAAIYPRYTHTVSLNSLLRRYSPLVGSGSNGGGFLWMKNNRAIGRCRGAFICAPGTRESHTTASGTVTEPGRWPSGQSMSANTVTGSDPRAHYRWVYR